MNFAKVVLGSFNSEYFWKPKDYVTILGEPSRQSSNIYTSMDEILFVFAKDGVLLSKYELDEAFHSYLQDVLGYNYNTISAESFSCDKMKFKSAYTDIITEINNNYMLEQLILSVAEKDCYAVTSQFPDTLGGFFPDTTVVSRVNSKEYSAKLSKYLACNPYQSTLCYSTNDILSCCMARDGIFMLKEFYGVSGSGNFIINSSSRLRSLELIIRKQEGEGKKVRCVIEPFVDTKEDFSVSYFISSDNVHQLLCVQKLINKKTVYEGSCSANIDFIHYLENKGYFLIMDHILDLLHEEGYFGYVNIDSMISEQYGIVPLVEINARKSMSMIQFQIEKMFSACLGCRGVLVSKNILVRGNVDRSQFMGCLKQDQLLFDGKTPNGILPLSWNTIIANQHSDKDQAAYHGKFIYAIPYSPNKNVDEYIAELTKRLSFTLSKINIRFI